MNKTYLAPRIEVVEIEIEDLVLASSGVEDFGLGTTLGSSDEFSIY